MTNMCQAHWIYDFICYTVVLNCYTALMCNNSAHHCEHVHVTDKKTDRKAAFSLDMLLPSSKAPAGSRAVWLVLGKGLQVELVGAAASIYKGCEEFAKLAPPLEANWRDGGVKIESHWLAELQVEFSCLGVVTDLHQIRWARTNSSLC